MGIRRTLVFFGFLLGIQDLAHGEVPAQSPSFQLGEGYFDSVEFLQDGDEILTTGSGGAYVWDAELEITVRSIGRLSGMRVLQHWWPPSNNGHAFAKDSAGLHVWNARTGTLTLLEGTAEAVDSTDTAVSPDGALAAASFSTNAPTNTQFEVRVWNIATGAEVQRFSAPPMLEFAPDAITLFTYGGQGQEGRLWNAPSGNLRYTLAMREWIHRRNHAFSPDGTRFAYVTATAVAEIKILDLATLNTVRTISPGQFYFKPIISFLNDGTRLLLENDEDTRSQFTRPPITVTLYDAITGSTIKVLGVDTIACSDYSPSLMVSQGGRYFATWRMARFDGKLYSSSDPLTAVRTLNIQPAVVSSDGTMMAGTDPNTGLHGVWSLESDPPSPQFGVPDSVLEVVAFRRDGQVAMAGYQGGYFHQYSTGDGSLISRFRCKTRSVKSIDYSPDGSRVLIGTGEGKVMLLDAATGVEIRSFHSSRLTLTPLARAAFLPDGRSAVVVTVGRARPDWNMRGDDTDCPTELAVWDSETGEETALLGTTVQDRRNLKMSPDRRYALVHGFSTKDPVEIWDMWRNERVWTLAESGITLRNPATAIDFAFSGDTLIFYNPANGDPTLVYWRSSQVLPIDPRLDGLKCFAPIGDNKRAIVASLALGTQLYSFEAQDFERSYISGPPAGPYLEMNPAVSPDGKKMVRYSYDSELAVLYDTGVPDAEPPLAGDMNDDGAVTPLDAQIAFECYLLGYCATPAKFIEADYCGNGSVTPSDAQAIFQVFLGVGSGCP